MRERASLEREVARLLGRDPFVVEGRSRKLNLAAPPVGRVSPQWPAGSDIREFEAPTAADRATFAVIARKIAEDKRRTRGDNEPLLRRMEALAKPLLDEDKEKSRQAVSALIDHLGKSSLPSATEDALAPVAAAFVARCYVLGLKNESKALTDFFAAKGDYLPVHARTGSARKLWALGTIADHLRNRPPPKDSASSRRRLDLLARMFNELSADFADPHTGPRSSGEQELQGLLETIFATLEVMVQGLTREFESGSASSASSLAAARQTLARVADQVLPRYERVPKQVEVTRSALTPKPRHLDFFEPARGPSIPITAYSELTPTFTDKSLWLNRVLEIRSEQLAALESIFGQANRLKVKLALHDNERWRTLALTIAASAQAGGKTPADALAEVMDVLAQYLRAFTLHTPMDIDDFRKLSVAAAMRENYLQREFPRAATGQRLHDCGVYAVRAAYILSGVRERLGFSERAILLPVHVGLVITTGNLQRQDQLAGASVFLLHNDLVEPVQNLARLADNWADGRAYDETRFLAALAASRYLAGVPLPFRFVPVPELKTATPAAVRRAALWQFYLTKITPRANPLVRDVLKGTTVIPEPWLGYLDVSELERSDSNNGAVPFSKRAKALWDALDHGKWLSRAKDLLHPRHGPIGRDRFRKAVAPIWKDYWTLSQQWRGTIEKLADARTRMRTFLTANPTALEQGAQVTEGADVLTAASLHETGFWMYMGELPSSAERRQTNASVALKRAEALAKSTLLTGSEVVAPWAKLPPLEPMD